MRYIKFIVLYFLIFRWKKDEIRSSFSAHYFPQIKLRLLRFCRYIIFREKGHSARSFSFLKLHSLKRYLNIEYLHTSNRPLLHWDHAELTFFGCNKKELSCLFPHYTSMRNIIWKVFKWSSVSFYGIMVPWWAKNIIKISFRSASIEIGRSATIIESNRLYVKIKEFRRRNLHYW